MGFTRVEPLNVFDAPLLLGAFPNSPPPEGAKVVVVDPKTASPEGALVVGAEPNSPPPEGALVAAVEPKGPVPEGAFVAVLVNSEGPDVVLVFCPRPPNGVEFDLVILLPPPKSDAPDVG